MDKFKDLRDAVKEIRAAQKRVTALYNEWEAMVPEDVSSASVDETKEPSHYWCERCRRWIPASECELDEGDPSAGLRACMKHYGISIEHEVFPHRPTAEVVHCGRNGKHEPHDYRDTVTVTRSCPGVVDAASDDVGASPTPEGEWSEGSRAKEGLTTVGNTDPAPASSEAETDWRGIHNDEGAELLREIILDQGTTMDEEWWQRVEAWAERGSTPVPKATLPEPIQAGAVVDFEADVRGREPVDAAGTDVCRSCRMSFESCQLLRKTKAAGGQCCGSCYHAIFDAKTVDNAPRDVVASPDCGCSCHYMAGVKHAVPCCNVPPFHATSTPPNVQAEWDNPDDAAYDDVPKDGPLLSQGTLDHLRSLPSGTLTQAEVEILCDEIKRLRGVAWDESGKRGTMQGFLRHIARTVGLGEEVESYDDVCNAVDRLVDSAEMDVLGTLFMAAYGLLEKHAPTRSGLCVTDPAHDRLRCEACFARDWLERHRPVAINASVSSNSHAVEEVEKGR